MFTVMGVTGQVGSQVAHNLLRANKPVRVVVREAAKATEWLARGCDVTVASIEDRAGLAKAFAGTEGVFLMIPPDYDPAPGFPKIQTIIENVRAAVRAAKPGKLVFLSTVGAHVERLSLLNNSRMMEHALRTLGVPVGFLRAAWFMENARWDTESAKGGVMPSFLQPLDHPIPMVATADIARVLATMLQESWDDTRVVELEGPRRYSANDIATGFAAALGHAVRAEPVPRDTWESLCRAQGMQYPEPRMFMIDGFNEGWIDFEFESQQRAYGSVPLEQVLRELIA
ncbi:NAD-dependent epimerase/dehydratase family protein [Dyella monticola]|uniref:NAD-dependent epimerase/dehydratase family protein n=1 Tax=Dyella monticola TaxID=1927958 RepID=A0A370WYB9_9GAMM|nr:NmrA family NAD(P)-binding protein [Dyella monticola]RDS81122.1 NAD-dependent epimerase/dehydratase family protein [Dyella monticola]